MDMNYFLNNANKTIGESARYARQLMSNPPAVSGSTGASGSQDQSLNGLNPIILLLLFQMMNRMMTQSGYGLPSSPFPPPLPQTGSPLGGTPLPTQNPAYQYLNNLFNNAAPSPVTITDNTSIQKRLDSIFAASANPNVTALSDQLRTMSPDDPSVPDLQSQIKGLLQADGKSARDLSELDILWQAQAANHSLPLLQIQATGNPSTELTAQINALQQKQVDLGQQWQALYPANGLSGQALASQVQTALKNGQFTETDLGSSLKYLLDQAPDATAGKAAELVSNLMESGDLNINPFLSNEYLSRLSPDRRQTLLNAVESSGLRMASGKANSRFIGFMLENLAKPGDSQTKAFLQQFLRDFYTVHGQQPDTPVGKLLAEVLDLADVQADAQNQLIFA